MRALLVTLVLTSPALGKPVAQCDASCNVRRSAIGSGGSSVMSSSAAFSSSYANVTMSGSASTSSSSIIVPNNVAFEADNISSSASVSSDAADIKSSESASTSNAPYSIAPSSSNAALVDDVALVQSSAIPSSLQSSSGRPRSNSISSTLESSSSNLPSLTQSSSKAASIEDVALVQSNSVSSASESWSSSSASIGLAPSKGALIDNAALVQNNSITSASASSRAISISASSAAALPTLSSSALPSSKAGGINNAALAEVKSSSAQNSSPTTGGVTATGTNCILASLPAQTIIIPGPTSRTTTEPPGTACVCPPTLTGFIVTSTNNVGEKFMVCEGLPGTHPATTFTTVTPTASEGASNPDWANVKCDFGSLSEASNNPWAQWNDSGADAAWKVVAGNWDGSLLPVTKGKLFSDFVADFFHARPSISCEYMDNPNCDTTVNCGQRDTPNADVSCPAGYVIINSLVSLHRILDQFYAATSTALAEVTGQMGSFTTTFSPIMSVIKAEYAHQQGLAIAQMVIGIGLAPFFNSALQRLSFFQKNQNFLGISGDVTAAAIGGGFTYDYLGFQADSPFTVQDQLTEYATQLTTTWQNLTQDLAMGMFQQTDVLYDIIKNGQMFATDPPTTEFDVSQKLVEAMFANALPLAWTLGTTVAQPFIGYGTDDDLASCDDSDPRKQSRIYTGDTGDFSSTEELPSTSKFCVDNQAYWLLSSKYDTGENPSTGSRSLAGLRVQAVQGAEALNGSSWGGLTQDTIFKAAYNSWNKAGKKNTITTLTLNDTSAIESLASGDITNAQGLVQLPICSFEDAISTALDDTEDKENPYWPCPMPSDG